MARSYDAASTTRRARLPLEARSDGAVLGQTYRLAAQVTERRQLLGVTPSELAEKTDIDQHQQDRAWFDLPEREHAFSPRRRPRCGVAEGRQGDGPNPALRTVSSDGKCS
jgi:hypothetical protein